MTTDTTPIVDLGLVGALSTRVEKFASMPIAAAKLNADYRNARLAQAREEAKSLGLNAGVKEHAPAVAVLIRRAEEDIQNEAAASAAKIAEHEAELLKVAAEAEIAEKALNPHSQYLQKLYRLPEAKRDSLLRFAGVLSESALTEVIRQADSAGDMATLAALYAITDAKPEWKSARQAMSAAKCGDLEVAQKALAQVKARTQFALANVAAVKEARPVRSLDRIAAGLVELPDTDSAAA